MTARRAPRPISLALQLLGEKLEPQGTLSRAQSAWTQAVGSDIAAHASPIAERGGTLTVRCTSSAWAAELEMRGVELTERLNAALPPEARVLKLRFDTR